MVYIEYNVITNKKEEQGEVDREQQQQVAKNRDRKEHFFSVGHY